MTPSDLDRMADEACPLGSYANAEMRRLARAVAAHALRWAAEEYQNTQPTMPGTVPGFSAFLRQQADALAHRQEPAQFTDSTGRKVLMPLDGSKVVGTVEPNEAKEART
jgi:hypothetical protein